MRRRALVLAAGEGRRLRPLTLERPKPLLPVLGKPLVGHTLDTLARAGVEACALNCHHLGEQIPAALGEEWAGMPLVFSHEAELLGTLGPLATFASFLAEADEVLLVNGDSLCDWPIARLANARASHGAGVAMLLSADADPVNFGGGIGTAPGGLVRRVPGWDGGGAVREHVFAGVHLFDPVLLRGIREQTGDVIRDFDRVLLEGGARIATSTTTRRWDDLGTPARYLRGIVRRLENRNFVAPTATVGTGTRLRRCAIEAGATVGEGCDLERTVVLDGAQIGRGATLRDVLVGFGATVAPGVLLEGESRWR